MKFAAICSLIQTAVGFAAAAAAPDTDQSSPRKLGLAYWQTCVGGELRTGEKLNIGDCLCSGDYQFCMDEYGALALLSDVYGEGYYVWEAPGAGDGGGGGTEGDFAKLQKNGNLSVRKGGESDPVWRSGTGGHSNALLSLDGQGIVTIESSGGESILWAEYERGCKWVDSREGDNNQILLGGQRLFPGQYICRNFYRFGMDDDGNLGVFYRAESQNGEDDDEYYNDYEDDWDNHDVTVWSANTHDEGLYVQMKKNGNLIVYNEGNEKVWQSMTKTEGDTNARLELKEGGEIQIINDSGGNPVWSLGPFDDMQDSSD
mmetsp:Transcript_47184/g.142885  ORF Transcript_47184/g.142885 Transcript_47184/m.142885 type:complete len:316 (-) Transcript_47184:26-973(-)